MLYLYTNVNPQIIPRPHVLRTSNELYGKAPDWEADSCQPFSEIEVEFLRKVVDTSDFNIFPNRGHYGWCRFPNYAVEQLIIGCMACDIDLEVIEWKPS